MFLLRRITHAADGREIVREQRIEATTLSIGRAAECDIALPDLAIDPHHADIALDGERRILITAAGTLGFQADGRDTRRAEIDATKGAELTFGGHRITVTGVPGAIVLTVRRAATGTDHYRDEARAFSLRGKLPPKRATAWLLALVILAAFLAWPVWNALKPQQRIYAANSDRSWSSGPLSQAHHALEGKCAACHVKAFVAVQDNACIACHKNVHDHADPKKLLQARATPGLGGRILAHIAKDFGKPGPGACTGCHTEHEGAGAMPPTRQAFCTDCHAGLQSRLPGSKLADAGDFGTAHPQFRPLVATTPGAAPVTIRASLDSKPADDSGLKFPHKLHLGTKGGVARMAQTLKAYGKPLGCADCHTPTADGVRFLPVDMEKNCEACHSLAFDRIGGTVRTLRHGEPAQMMADLRALYRSTGPARPPELTGMARRRPGQYAQGQLYSAYFGAVRARPAGGDAAIRAVFSPGGACYDCHTVTPPGTNGARDWTVMPVHQSARYLTKGWFDHQAHATQKCASCHVNAAASTKSTDLLIPGIKTCRNCHGGEASAAPVPSPCASCHSYHTRQDAPWTSRLRFSAAPVTRR